MTPKVLPLLQYEDVSLRVTDRMTVDIKDFESQLRYLKRKKYHTVSLMDALSHISRYHPKKVVLTFDGGYLTHYQYVFPLLERYKFKAVFFVPTDYIGGLSMWSQYKKNLLSIEDMFEMKQFGMEFGVLAATNTDLTTKSAENLKTEIIDSKQHLEKALLTTIDYFAYPQGKYNNEIIKMVEEAGYKAAVSTFNRSNKIISYQPYAMDRVPLFGKPKFISTISFKLALGGRYIL